MSIRSSALASCYPLRIIGYGLLAIALPSSAAELVVDYTLIRNLPGADYPSPFGINASGDVSGVAFINGFTENAGAIG